MKSVDPDLLDFYGVGIKAGQRLSTFQILQQSLELCAQGSKVKKGLHLQH